METPYPEVVYLWELSATGGGGGRACVASCKHLAGHCVLQGAELDGPSLVQSSRSYILMMDTWPKLSRSIYKLQFVYFDLYFTYTHKYKGQHTAAQLMIVASPFSP